MLQHSSDLYPINLQAYVFAIQLMLASPDLQCYIRVLSMVKVHVYDNNKDADQRNPNPNGLWFNEMMH